LKKNKILLIFVLLEILFYIYFIVVQKTINVNLVWFSLILILIGAYSLSYSLLYNMDSECYYGILLVLLGTCECLKQIKQIEFSSFYPIYILCFAFSNFAVFVLFRQNIHIKLFAILFSVGILIAGYKLDYLKLYQLLILIGVIVSNFILSILFRLRKNLRRIK